MPDEDTKQCFKCKEIKPLSEFYKQAKKGVKGRQSYCKACSTKRRVQYYKDNQERENRLEKERRKLIQKKWKEWKSDKVCILCGEDESVCLDLHHISPDEKDYNISTMIGFSFERMLKEADKCIIVCSNCHRKIHAGLISIL